MPVQLHVVAGDHTHKLVDLKESQVYVVGRSSDADLSFENDLQMSSRHLSITAAAGKVFIEDLGSTNGTFLNGNPVSQTDLTPEDVFRCGSTEFRIVDVSSDVGRDAAATSVAVTARQSTGTVEAPVFEGVSLQIEGFIEESAAAVVERFQLADEFPIAPEAGETPEMFVKRLVDLGEPNYCVTFLAYALAKRASVWWLAKCIERVESLHGEADLELLEIVHKWVLEPSDALRRQAMKQAELLEMSTPASWAAVGAFWSGGSMGPVGTPVVEAKDELLGKAISGGAILASVLKSPEKAFEKQKQFVELGLDIAAGKLELIPN